MAKRKTKKKPATMVELHRLHAAYLAAPGRKDRDDNDPSAPSLRVLAKRFGVPFEAADREACLGRWELERRAAHAWAWHEQFGGGAKTEEDFVAYCVDKQYGHLTAEGPEGRDLAAAHARDIWTRAMPAAFEWEAHLELERAQAVYEAIKEVRNKLASRRAA